MPYYCYLDKDAEAVTTGYRAMLVPLRLEATTADNKATSKMLVIAPGRRSNILF